MDNRLKVVLLPEYEELFSSDLPVDRIYENILLSTLQYYVGHNRRCTSSMGCVYSGKSTHKNTDGCAVGRLLMSNTRENIDKISYGIAVCGYDEKIDWGILNNHEDFLHELQKLHDSDVNWSHYKLSRIGIESLDTILFTYNINKTAFKKYLTLS